MLGTFARAGNHYVLASPGTGTNTGTDWANACSGFTGNCAPSNMIRGDTYYIGGAGPIAPPAQFNTTNSSTSIVTLKKAIASDHGTDTGWNAIYAAQTHFSCSSNLCIYFTSDHWMIDGQIGSMTTDTTAYGFVIDLGSCSHEYTNISIGKGSGDTHTDFTFKHMYAQACSSDIGKGFMRTEGLTGEVDNVTLSDVLMDGFNAPVWARGNGTYSYGWLIERNIFLNDWSTPTNHGSGIDSDSQQLYGATIRYNLFTGPPQYGSDCVTAYIEANNTNMQAPEIYGNVFANLRPCNELIGGTSAGGMFNAKVYNNTVINSGAWQQTYSWGENPWVAGGTGGGGGKDNVAYNNLVYNQNASVGAGFTTDYNYYISTHNTPTETHGQVGSTNPFVNLGAQDYHLTGPTVAGYAFPSPYNLDPDGFLRGADGTWDRGAYEYGPSSSVAPPTGLSATVQ